MKNAIIIHGTGGSPEGNWFSWMKEKLQEQGYAVIVPHFPAPQFQSLQSWMAEFKNHRHQVNEDTIFIAHSVGPAFVLSILETLEKPVRACFFVSGFLEVLQLPEFDPINETITIKQFDWKKIHQNCPYFFMCHGSDDPYVPLYNAEIMADKLNVEIDIIADGAHLNEENGYTQFPYLLEKILTL
jgi:uncharacterized protein